MTKMHKFIYYCRSIAGGLFIAALLRFGLMIVAFVSTGTSVMTQGDTASYLEPGRNLLLHGVYASGGLPEIDRTPGYPVFLMLTGMFTGNVLLSVMTQIGLSLLSLLLIRRIAERVFDSEPAGMIAAWFYAVEPVSIMYSVRLMPETLFVFLLLLVIDRLLVFLSTYQLRPLCLAGLSLATATYVRPVSYYLVIPLAMALVIVVPRGNGLRWKAPAVLLLTVVPLLAGWQIRNRFETGYSGFSSIVEKNLYFYQSAEVTAELKHVSLGNEQRDLGYLNEASYVVIHPEQSHWSQAQRLVYMRRESVQILSANRDLYLKTHFEGIGVVAFTPCASELLQLLGEYPGGSMMPRRLLNEGVLGSLRRVITSYPGVAIAMAILEVFLLFLYLFAVLGIWNGKGHRDPILLVVGVAAYFLLISGGAQAVGRYRLPVMPELCMLAAGGIASVKKREARGHTDPAVLTRS
jgi:hypothetical protein